MTVTQGGQAPGQEFRHTAKPVPADPVRRIMTRRPVGVAPAATLREVAGRQTSELDDGVPHEVVHRDDLVVLPA